MNTNASAATPAVHIALLFLALLVSAPACTLALAGGEGHGHGQGHGHNEGPDPLALTLWSATHELFVEFDPPVAGKPSGYHAHVSRIADNGAATEGRFSVRFEQGGKALAEVTVDKVARTGIFTPKGVSPKEPGTYNLVFVYKSKEESSRWDAGAMKISEKPAEVAAQAEGDITFLKEQQWPIPFATRLPDTRKLAREIALPATVAAHPELTHTVSAPSAGAVIWAGEKGPSVIGMMVRRGQILGRLEPAAAPDHVSTVQLQIQRGIIQRDHARQALNRVAALAKEGLVPARREADARTALGRAQAALKAAKQKAGQLRGRRVGSLPLVAPVDGILVELHISNGHEAAAGQVLAHLAAEDRVLVQAAAFSLDLPRLSVIRGARLLIPGRAQMIPFTEQNSRLLTRRVVVHAGTLTAPVAYQVENPKGVLRIGELTELRLAVGEQKEHLTIPKTAVVEINTRPYVFVMRTGESFTRLMVRPGPTNGERVAVLSGLSATDRVVATGAFDVYAASLAGAVESHRH